MKLIANEIFISQSLVNIFSKFSRDINPLHADENYARKTPFGNPICHGCLATLALFSVVEEIQSGYISSLKVEFLEAVHAGRNYLISSKSLGDQRHIIRLFEGDRLVLECQLAVENRHIESVEFAQCWEGDNYPIEVPAQVAPSSINEGDQYSLSYSPDWTVVEKLFNELNLTISQLLVNIAGALAFCSYWIGMKIPGRQALFSRLHIHFHPNICHASTTSFTGSVSISSLDRAYDLITQEVSLKRGGSHFATASLNAFFRPQATLVDLAGIAVSELFERELVGRNIVITGASRGLGASLALTCLLNGATVYGVYQKSSSAMEQLKALLPEAVRHRLISVQGDCCNADSYSALKKELNSNRRKIDFVFFSATPALQNMSLSLESQTRFSEYIDRSFQMLLTPLTVLDAHFDEQVRLVFISTIALEQPVAAWAHYVASKGGLESLITSLALNSGKRRWYIVRLPQMRTDLVYAITNRHTLLAPEKASEQIIASIAHNSPGPSGYAMITQFERDSGSTPIATQRSAIACEPCLDLSHACNPESVDAYDLVSMENRSITIAASFTLDPIKAAMGFWLNHPQLIQALGHNLVLRLAPYGQVTQTCLTQDSEFYHRESIANVLLLRLEDAVHYHKESYFQEKPGGRSYRISAELTEQTQLCVTQWCQAITHYHGNVPLFVWLCRDSNGFEALSEYAGFKRKFGDQLADACKQLSAVYFRLVDTHEPNPMDEQRNEIAHIPYLDYHYRVLSTSIIRALCAARFSPRKVIVCDCDNTLWSGVVGEDGVDGIGLDEGHLALQAKLVSMVEQGFLVCLCSKNNRADVEAVFAQRRDMLLQPQHITGWRVNWLPKSENINSLAEELNLGLDSFVFIDDNPVEILQVEQQIASVLSIRIPEASRIREMVEQFWFADRLTVTSEDRRRTSMYQGQAFRQQTRSNHETLMDYIRELEIQTDIQPLTLESITRISQLSLKTNQFNLTTMRMDEHAVRGYYEEQNKLCWSVHVRDKFGDYGLVGAMFAHRSEQTLYMDNLLLSCRVLGRGIEYNLLNYIGKFELDHGRSIVIRYQPSANNAPALQFLQQAFCALGLKELRGGEIEVEPQFLSSLAICEVERNPCGEGAVSHKPKRLNTASSASVMAENEFYRYVIHSLTGQEASDSQPIETEGSGRSKATATVESSANGLWTRIKSVIEETLVNLDEQVTDATLFDQLSLTSLMMVNLTVALSREFDFRLSSTYLYGLKTLADLQHKISLDLIGNGSKKAAIVASDTAPSANTATASVVLRESEKLAIIGVSGRYPNAANIDELWDVLANGQCCVGEVSSERWNQSRVSSGLSRNGHQSYANFAALIDDVDKFDTALFNISPKDARLMDPQQRWFLTISYECLLSAGYCRRTVARDTGVFVGAMAKDYQILCAPLVEEGRVPFPYADLYQIANRVSYFLDLNGPSITVDTACSSSGVALHMAFEAIRKGECSQALVGGVNLILHPQRHIQYTQMQMLSKEGLCRSFSDQASGMVMGEGVGCILLKPLSQALADGDPIHGTLLATHVNSGGRTSGFTVPNPVAQAELIRTTIKKAAIEADTINYVEAHGTGTPLGDPIEVEGIASALQRHKSTATPCLLGSIKSNIGHLEPAAAIAGLTKVLLQFNHDRLVPSLHAEILNHQIDFDRHRLSVQRCLAPWPAVEGNPPRRAGVSSFGAGGVNAHIIVEEFNDRQVGTEVRISRQAKEMIVPLSAQSEAALAAMIAQLHEFLVRYRDRLSLPAVAYTLQTGRDEFRYRASFIVDSVDQLQTQLATWEGMRSHSPCSVCADVKEYQDDADIFTDCEMLVQQWLDQGKLKKIASLWVRGAEIPWLQGWNTLWRTEKNASLRIRLPGYPFMGSRQWVEGAQWRKQAVELASDRQNAAENGLFQLSTSDYFVADHVVNEQCILPGVSYLAMLASWLKSGSQLSKSPEGCLFGLTQMLWMRPLVFSDHQSRQLTIIEQDQNIKLIGSQDKLYVKCRLNRSSCAQNALDPIDLPALMPQLTMTLHRQECYQHLTAQGFQYGPGLQCVESVQHDGTRILGCLTRQAATTAEPWELCSGLLDAGLQTTIIVNNSCHALLPFACEEMIFYQINWPETIYSLATITQLSQERMTCNLGFYDQHGRPLMMMAGLTLLANKSSVREGDAFYISHWLKADEPLTVASIDFRQTDVIILNATDSEFSNIATRMQSVFPQAAIHELIMDSSQAFVLPDRFPEPDQRQRIVIDLISAGLSDFDHLPLLQIYRRYPVNTRYLVAWVDRKDVEQNALGESYTSLSRALLHETDRFQLKTLKIQNQSGWLEMLPNVLEIGGDPGFRYIEQQLEYLAFTKAGSLYTTTGGIAFEQGGVYWLTGNGGIARTLADQIIERYRAIVVLTGRRSIDAVLASCSSQFSDRLVYIQSDINVPEDCQAVYDQIIDRFGKLNGIIHTAGVVHDDRLVNQTDAGFAAVLAPKVLGTRHLYPLLQQDRRLWLILCSSIAAVVGNIGQSSYAMANGYLDAIARQVQDGRVLSIDWPLWLDTGMSAAAGHLVEHNRRMGFGYLQAEQGLDILQQAMAFAGNVSQVIYLPGDEVRIQEALKLRLAPIACLADPQPDSQPSRLGSERIRSRLLERLFFHTYELLELPEGVLEADEDLSSYGFDSISLTDFAERLNQEFDLEISPVLLFDFPTLNGLADELVGRFADKLSCSIGSCNAPESEQSVYLKGADQIVRHDSPMMPDISLVPSDEQSPQLTITHSASKEPIAIIGLACRFPGADTLDQFWENLNEGRNLIKPIPTSRFKSEHNKYFAGLVDHLEYFDPEFFKMTGREAVLMDPQHRILLELSWQAIEHAGYHPSSLAQSQTGVFIGITLHDHLQRLHDIGQSAVSHLATGNVHCLAANRLSYLFNFNGPSEAVDTACSSSLVALNRAIKALQNGECEAALVGGVNALLTEQMFDAFTEAGMLSPSGRCHTFSANADGYVRGEGGGVIFLKPLSRARADNDVIHAVIKGIAVNHGGHGQSLTAPSAKAQAKVIEMALQDAGVNQASIGYIEAHGTGTQLGDPIELEGLRQVFGSHKASPAAYVGTVKTNIGHLESASGMAGLIKVIMAMKHRCLPRSLHGKPLNKLLNPAEQPFEFLTETTPWIIRMDEQGEGLPLRAGISSFGFGGVNSHVIVEEGGQQMGTPQSSTQAIIPRSSGRQLILVSAVSEKLLQEQLAELKAIVSTLQELDLPALAMTSRHARGSYNHRAVFVVDSLAGLKYEISRFLAGKSMPLEAADNNRQDGIDVMTQTGQWEALAGRWLAGENIRWSDYEAPTALVKTRFPLTRFNRRSCSIELLQTDEQARSSSVKPVLSDSPFTPPTPENRLSFYTPVWQEKVADAAVSVSRRTVLLLVPDRAVLAWSARVSAANRHDWYILRLSGVLPRLGRHELEVDIDQEDALESLFSTCAQKGIQPDWIVDVHDLEHQDHHQTEPQWQSRIRLLQLCVRAWSHQGVRLFHIASENAAVYKDWFSCLYAGLSAEYRNLNSKTITLDKPLPLDELERVLAAEEQQADNGTPVSILDGKRRELDYRICPVPVVFSDFQLNPELAYLVTGGLGGLGLQATKVLLNHGARKVLLLGRRDLDDVDRQSLHSLQTDTATVLYFTSLSLLTEHLNQQPVRIAGVMHCAGIDTQGELAFINKSMQSFRDCLAPKLILAKELCCELMPHLDPAALSFFIGFSSVSAIVPVLTAGRSDYAPANAALDQWIVNMARQFPDSGFVTVQWPSHQRGGMPAVSSDIYRDTGLPCLSPQQSSDILLAVMASAFRGELRYHCLMPQIGEAVPVIFNHRMPASVAVAPVEERNNIPHLQQEALLTRLKSLFASKLLLNEEALKPETPFEELGIDSILIADLVHAIEQDLNCILPPSAILEHPSLVQLADCLVELTATDTGRNIEADESSIQSQPSTDTRQVLSHVHAGKSVTENSSSTDEKVAVIGMACRFPGAGSIEAFWQNLKLGVCSVTEMPGRRFDIHHFYSPAQQPGKSISKWGGFIDGVDLFDPEFFDIPEEHAAYIDPLTRLSLMVSTEAIADAGYRKEDIWGCRCGVYMGGNRSHYGLEHVDQTASATGLNQNFIAAHLAHVFNLTGPCYVIDAACTSSLLSIHSAMRDLLSHDVDIALAGGVEALIDETPYLKLSAAGALSPDGLCHTFSRYANGFVPGEGAGVVVLKRLSDALRDSDAIHAVIEASDVNNDGYTMGLTTPNINAQKGLLERIYHSRPDLASGLRYIEAHGTGTMIGDPIELKAMASVFDQMNIPQGQVAVGSVKSNLGHLMGAAGVASFIKTVLVVKHRWIPETLHCSEPNPRFNFSNSPLVPANGTVNLSGLEQPLIAGVSAFGFGGTNCHICLSDDYPCQQRIRKPLPKPSFNLRSFWLKGRELTLPIGGDRVVYAQKGLSQEHQNDNGNRNRTILELEWL